MSDRILYQAALKGLEVIYIERTIPKTVVEPCLVRCLSCKRFIDIDYEWIAGQDIERGHIFDLDCPHCWSLNCFSAVATSRKIRTFKKKCEKWLDPSPDKAARVPTNLRFRVLQRDSFTCQYCGASPSDGTSLHVDHKISTFDGGQTRLENLVTACAGCNLGKGSQSVFD